MSPNCCTTSRERATVTLFVPAGDGGYWKVHWAVPMRNTDSGDVIANGVTPADFCPFCGTALGPQHVPFEEPQRTTHAVQPASATEKK